MGVSLVCFGHFSLVDPELSQLLLAFWVQLASLHGKLEFRLLPLWKTTVPIGVFEYCYSVSVCWESLCRSRDHGEHELVFVKRFDFCFSVSLFAHHGLRMKSDWAMDWRSKAWPDSSQSTAVKLLEDIPWQSGMHRTERMVYQHDRTADERLLSIDVGSKCRWRT